MGVSVQDLAVPRARPLDSDGLHDYDLSDCDVVWPVFYRNPNEQGGRVGQWVMKVVHYFFGLPTTAPYHFMGVCDSEAKARAMCIDKNWTIGPVRPNRCFPLKRVNWKGHYSPKAFFQLNPESGEVDEYELVPCSEREREKAELRAIKDELAKALGH